MALERAKNAGVKMDEAPASSWCPWLVGHYAKPFNRRVTSLQAPSSFCLPKKTKQKKGTQLSCPPAAGSLRYGCSFRDARRDIPVPMSGSASLPRPFGPYRNQHPPLRRRLMGNATAYKSLVRKAGEQIPPPLFALAVRRHPSAEQVPSFPDGGEA